MTLRRLGLVGAGGMADTVLTALADLSEAPLDLVTMLILPDGVAAANALLARGGARLAARRCVHTDFPAFLADRPDLIVECAGHGAIRSYGVAILQAGIDLLAVSTGAFADDALRAAVTAAAKSNGTQVFLSSGAVGGIDVLAAAALSGLRSVVYSGRKPPLAWRGTPAERLIDLATLDEARTFFEGSAREAATAYPQNANVAATVALAGAGLDATRVRLIADPTISRNVHEIAVEAACAVFTIRLEGQASPANPKTSLTAGFSLARQILDRRSAFVL